MVVKDGIEKAEEAARLNAREIADELADLGIDVDCLPLLDVPAPGGHDIIGDRAFSTDPDIVARLGRARPANGFYGQRKWHVEPVGSVSSQLP